MKSDSGWQTVFSMEAALMWVVSEDIWPQILLHKLVGCLQAFKLDGKSQHGTLWYTSWSTTERTHIKAGKRYPDVKKMYIYQIQNFKLHILMCKHSTNWFQDLKGWGLHRVFFWWNCPLLSCYYISSTVNKHWTAEPDKCHELTGIKRTWDQESSCRDNPWQLWNLYPSIQITRANINEASFWTTETPHISLSEKRTQAGKVDCTFK